MRPGPAQRAQRDLEHCRRPLGQLLGGLLGLRHAAGHQPGHDLLHAVGRVAGVDPRTLLRERRGRRRLRVPGDDLRHRKRTVEIRQQLRQLRRGHEVVGEPAQQRVAGRHRGGAQPQVGAQLAGRAGQQPAAADVRHQADPGLRQGHHRTLGDDPHRAVGGDADAAAHGDAVHHGHVRLRVAGDQLVEPVLVAEERARPGPAELGVVVEGPDVAARAQAALPGAGQHHHPHGVVLGPRVQRGPQVQHHAVRQRVERPGPVEHDPPHPAVPPDQHLVAHRPHSRPSSPTDPSDTVLVVGDGAGRCDHGRPSGAAVAESKGAGWGRVRAPGHGRRC